MLEGSIADPDYLQAVRSLGLHSYMGVPLLAQGRVLGVISFITSDSRRVFTERDLAHARDLAAHAAVAITNAELLEALRRSDAAKDVFLATLAHELRNPLAPIVTSIALLARAEDSERYLPQVLDVLQRQSKHLARLVDLELVIVHRLETGAFGYELTWNPPAMTTHGHDATGRFLAGLADPRTLYPGQPVGPEGEIYDDPGRPVGANTPLVGPWSGPGRGSVGPQSEPPEDDTEPDLRWVSGDG